MIIDISKGAEPDCCLVILNSLHRDKGIQVMVDLNNKEEILSLVSDCIDAYSDFGDPNPNSTQHPALAKAIKKREDHFSTKAKSE